MNGPDLTGVECGVLKQMTRQWWFSFCLCSLAQNKSHSCYDVLFCHRPKAKAIQLKMDIQIFLGVLL